MAYTPRAGRNARILLDASVAANAAATPVSGKNQWSVDQSVPTFETTAFGDSNKTYVTGLPDATGDLSGFWDSDDNNIYNVIGSSLARKFYLYPDFANNAGTYFFGTVFVSVKLDGGTGGPVQFSASWSAASVVAWVHP